MSGFLHRRLLAGDRRTMFHQFHHSASSAIQSTPATAASSMLYQILESIPDVETSSMIGELVKLAEKVPTGPQYCQFQPLWAIVEAILTSHPGWTLIMDAFDECTADGASAPEPVGFLNLLRVIAEKTSTRILILSRHDSRFDTVIGPLLSIYLEDRLLLHDIMIFAQAEHDRLDLPESDKILVMERVRSSSQGSFWWVKLFLDYLSRALQESEFHARLYSLAPSIKGFYEEILLQPKPGLDKEEIDCRNHIFLLDFQAQRTLTVAEIGDALSLRPDRAGAIILRLCKPLVSTRGGLFQLSHQSVLEYFESYQRTSETYLGFSFSDSHAVLATRCLSCLLRKDYASLELAATSLRASFEEIDRFQDRTGPASCGFYNYASRYWHYHLTRVKLPQANIIRQIDEFLHSINFVFWIHYCDSQFGRRMGVVGPLERVKSWHAQLSTNTLSKIQIDDCYTSSYHKLISAFALKKTGSVCQLLAQMSLYDHHLGLGLFQEDSTNRDRVVSQLDNLLGSKNPIVLRAKASIAYTRLLQGRMRAARRMYSELTDCQRELVGKDDVRFIEAVHYRGEGEYYMTDFAAAAITFTATSAGFLKILGPDRWSYLAAQLWYASAMAHLDQLDTALKIVQSLFQKRREAFGSHDSLAVTIQIGFADLLRAAGDHVEAIRHLREIVGMRRESCSLTDIYRLDVEILLARTLQEAGLYKEATFLVRELEEYEGFGTHFERDCQVVHLKGLLSAANGNKDEAINILQDIVIQAEQDQNNRALVWIRLDLADMLRLRNEEGDTQQASSLFDNLVKDLSGDCEPGFPDEPDPPRLLAVAEKALRLTRSLKHTEARQVLDLEHFDWLRPSDLWLWVSEVILI
jgi:tetratricopeptide (TPR) repeat protein